MLCKHFSIDILHDILDLAKQKYFRNHVITIYFMIKPLAKVSIS